MPDGLHLVTRLYNLSLLTRTGCTYKPIPKIIINEMFERPMTTTVYLRHMELVSNRRLLKTSFTLLFTQRHISFFIATALYPSHTNRRNVLPLLIWLD